MPEISVILSSGGPAAPATAIALANSGMGVASIPPETIALMLKARQEIIQMMEGGKRMTSEELRKLGQFICKALFDADVGATWTHALSTGGTPSTEALSTTLLATTKELKAIPWEYAAWPDGVDGPHQLKSVVRIVPQARTSTPPPIVTATEGLRVLLLSASPLGLTGIPWPDVRDDLIKVFKGAFTPPVRLLPPKLEVVGDDEVPSTNRFVRIVEAATRENVAARLEADQPHVVHFVGHGTDKGLALIKGKNAATVLSANAFEKALAKAPSVRLVILSACDVANTKTFDPVDETVGTLAEQLVRNAVPAVVASQTVIDKRTIAPFCRGMYPLLLESRSIDDAVAEGRCEIVRVLDEADKAAIEWGIPVLYRRLGASKLFA
jgi:hypothetical protein